MKASCHLLMESQRCSSSKQPASTIREMEWSMRHLQRPAASDIKAGHVRIIERDRGTPASSPEKLPCCGGAETAAYTVTFRTAQVESMRDGSKAPEGTNATGSVTCRAVGWLSKVLPARRRRPASTQSREEAFKETAGSACLLHWRSHLPKGNKMRGQSLATPSDLSAADDASWAAKHVSVAIAPSIAACDRDRHRARRGYSGYVCFRGPLKALARLPDPLERFLRAAARDRDQDAPGHQKAGGFAVPRSHTLRRKWLRREESLPAERLRVGRTASTKKPLQTRACLPANREAVRNNRSPGFSKKKHATAPRVPARFLSVVLMRPSPASLPRSDGIGCCLGGMTVACSNIGELKHEPTGAAKRQV